MRSFAWRHCRDRHSTADVCHINTMSKSSQFALPGSTTLAMTESVFSFSYPMRKRIAALGHKAMRDSNHYLWPEANVSILGRKCSSNLLEIPAAKVCGHTPLVLNLSDSYIHVQ